MDLKTAGAGAKTFAYAALGTACPPSLPCVTAAPAIRAQYTTVLMATPTNHAASYSMVKARGTPCSTSRVERKPGMVGRMPAMVAISAAGL